MGTAHPASRTVVLGTRGSQLAMAQSRLVAEWIQRRHPSLSPRLERIRTTGDVQRDVPLATIGGAGVFVDAIEQALRAGEIDIAVHSAKDMPARDPDDLVVAAYPERLDARDALVSRAGTLAELPAGAIVGTSSQRRACQIRAARPDVQIRDLRGNVDTRLAKLDAGQYDAVVLGAAGLLRLGLAHRVTQWFAVQEMLPAPAQGALAVQVRAADGELREMLAPLTHEATAVAVEAERAFLERLGAGCAAAVAVHATLERDTIVIRALIGSPDGRAARGERRGLRREHRAIAMALADEMMAGPARAYLTDRAGLPLAGRRVVLTRPAAQAGDFEARVRALGGIPVVAPAIAIAPPASTEGLDAALRELESFHWIVFTSSNAVRALMSRAGALHVPRRLIAGRRLAAVGAATAAATSAELRAPDFVSEGESAAAMTAELPVKAGERVLFPRAELARDAVAAGLRSRDVEVADPVAYRTVAGPGARQAAEHFAAGSADALLFASPSAVAFVMQAGPLVAPPVQGAARPAIFCIGDTTAAAARAAGLQVAGVAHEASLAALIATAAEWFAARPRREDHG